MLLPLKIQTNGEEFYDITSQIQSLISQNCHSFASGMVFIMTPHTSCGLTINESYDPSAKKDLEAFLRHTAPRDLNFISHTSEGPDDSPSHMKTLLTSQNIALPLQEGNLVLGTWEGIYLCEFRDAPKKRSIHIKVMLD